MKRKRKKMNKLTPKDYLKLELMLYAIDNDYFSYGSAYEKKNGRYYLDIEGEHNVCTASELISDFDGLSDSIKKDIVENYIEDNIVKNDDELKTRDRICWNLKIKR